MNYYTHIHLDSSINTVDKFLDEAVPVAVDISKNDFLNFKDENGTTNREQIIKESGDVNSLLPGTVLFIPKKNFNNELAFIYGSNVFLRQQDINLFTSEILKEIQDDPDYRRTNSINTDIDNYRVSSIINDVQVWCYSRALNKVINITPYIISCSTSVQQDGGGFEITLPPISDVYNNFQTDKDIYNYTDIIKSGGELNENWFMKNLQKNDIFFIRFEKLRNESRIKQLEINKTQLPNQIYDMIGLMDTVSFSYNPQINEANISVTGRDLTKLLIEDASFFHPFAFIENGDEFFVNIDKGNRWFNRLFVSGQFKNLFTLGFKSIRAGLGFIFNQLTNTGVTTDNDLFSAYGDKRSKTYEVDGLNDEDLKEVTQNGIYQIINLLVDNKLDNRRTANDGISNPDGTILEQCYKICQQPFVEFWGDTHGDRFVFMARQPPFTREQIKQYIDNELVVEIEQQQVSNISLDFSTEYYTWYQLKPENSFLGKNDYVHLAYFPAILVPQYMDIFGNNRMVISSNYISYQALTGEGSDTNVNLFRQAAVNDLMYIIESTIYLPFTRRGTITIKGGDRRIKKGNWVYFKPTDEYFYVTSVVNSFRVGRSDIDRETVITVERGMKSDFIKGKSINLINYLETGKDVSVDGGVREQSTSINAGRIVSTGRVGNYPNEYKKRFKNQQFNVSYFDIMNIEEVRNTLTDFSSDSRKSVTINSVINEDVLNFFMYKLQFE